MSTSIADILRRRRREPLDERLPDGRSVDDLLRVTEKRNVISGAGGQGEPLSQSQVLTPQNQQAITRPRQTFNTSLSPEDEIKFEQWKAKYAPNDSGEDYDLRGAYKAGLTPDSKTGHWEDTFKKPNHPTFSNLSQYAVGSNAAKAGHWEGDRFVPPTSRHPPLGPQPPRPSNIPVNAHWDATGIGPDGGEWIAPADLTRSRATGSIPTYNVPESETTRPRAVSFDPQTGRPNEDYYRERGDTAGLYEATRNWEPHGGKRGFKNSLKAALLMGAEGARANPNDPVTGALAGLAIGGAAGTAVPNLTNRLRRQQQLGQLGGELKRDLDLKKQQAAIDQSQMVEVELDNGQHVMVPARTAAALQSRQQEIGLRGDTLEARKGRWDKLGEHEAARDAQALYNSGAADDSAELRAEIARRLRLPTGTVLPPRGLGNQIKLDESGNYVIVNPRSGQVTQTNQQSYEPTREKGRDRRATQAQQAAMSRVQAQQAGANQRAGMRGTGPARLDSTTRNNIAKGVGAVEAVKGELTQIDAQIKALDDATKGRALTPEEQSRITSLGRQRQEKVNQAKAITAQLDALDPNNETGVGEGGYPYRKPRQQAAPSDLDRPIYGKPSGRTIEGAINAFKRKVGRAPTAEEIAKMKAALGQ